jgi:hypothetical protein
VNAPAPDDDAVVRAGEVVAVALIVRPVVGGDQILAVVAHEQLLERGRMRHERPDA